MTTGIVLLNFGEPSEIDRESIKAYLERIFMANAELEEYDSLEEAHQRSRKLAKRRAPQLLDEYEAIGGSPLNEQARWKVEALETELRDRGFDVRTYLGMQYTEPFIEDAAETVMKEGVDDVIGFPIYPLCGPSTNIISLDQLETALEELGWNGQFRAISGWHRYPRYNHIRAENIDTFADEHDVDLHDKSTSLVFSAHGTPQHYLDEGSRYDVYVEEYCSVIASLLDIEDYYIGFQNHGNRDIPWTEPPVEDLFGDIDAERVVVEPVSFLHEQSETLSELDIDLREEAKEIGLDFYRVPIPHDDERLPEVFADLVEPFLAGFAPEYYQFQRCKCRNKPGTMCLNAPQETPHGTDDLIDETPKRTKD